VGSDRGESGLSHDQIDEAALLYAQSERVIACWGMGITQHERSVATIQMIANLLLLRVISVAPAPERVRFAGTAMCKAIAPWELRSTVARLLERLGRVFQFDPPRAPGVDTIGAIEAMLAGRAKVFFAMGGNFAASTPDTATTWKALRSCELTVHVATKFNRSHVVHGRQALMLLAWDGRKSISSRPACKVSPSKTR